MQVTSCEMRIMIISVSQPFVITGQQDMAQLLLQLPCGSRQTISGSVIFGRGNPSVLN